MSLKFGDLSVERLGKPTWFLKVIEKSVYGLAVPLVYCVCVKMDDEATTDDDLQEDLPYLEMLYKFVFGKYCIMT